MCKTRIIYQKFLSVDILVVLFPSALLLEVMREFVHSVVVISKYIIRVERLERVH
jgi:hypothetical protein